MLYVPYQYPFLRLYDNLQHKVLHTGLCHLARHNGPAWQCTYISVPHEFG